MSANLFHCFFKRICKITPLLFIAIFILSCSEQQPVKVVFIGASSGQNSEVVVSVRNSVQLYFDKVNQSGGINGKQISLHSFDNRLDSEYCGELFQTIIEDDYKFVIGPIFSQMANITLDSILNHDILVLSPTMGSRSLSKKDDNFLRVCLNNTDQAKIIANFITAKKYKKLAVVYDKSNAKYAEKLYKDTWSFIQPHGVELVHVTSFHKDEQLNMYPIAEQIHSAQPDCLLMGMSAINAANLAQQIRKLNDTIQFIGSSWSQTNDLIELGGKSVNNMVLVSVNNNLENEKFLSFKQEFTAKYGHAPSFPAILGYNAAEILVKGMTDAETITPDKVKHSILQQKTFDGLTGPVQFDNYGDVIGNYYLVTVKDYQFHKIDIPL